MDVRSHGEGGGEEGQEGEDEGEKGCVLSADCISLVSIFSLFTL